MESPNQIGLLDDTRLNESVSIWIATIFRCFLVMPKLLNHFCKSRIISCCQLEERNRKWPCQEKWGKRPKKNLRPSFPPDAFNIPDRKGLTPKVQFQGNAKVPPRNDIFMKQVPSTKRGRASDGNKYISMVELNSGKTSEGSELDKSTHPFQQSRWITPLNV